MDDQNALPGGRPVRALRQRLESLARAGVTHLPKPRYIAPPAPIAAQAAAGRPTQTESRPGAPPVEEPAEPHDTAIRDDGGTMGGDGANNDTTAWKRSELQAWSQRVAKCVRCRELAETRTQTVFGEGNPNARLVFLGEAPGSDEDRQGRPFVGRAGKLLTDIIEKGMKLRREDVYILNILKCRPPGNRNPEPVEAASCREYLDAQLEIIEPEFICCLGAVAAQNLLDTTRSIGQLRGDFRDYGDIRVVCTYHPAYLLRNPAAKKKTWEDIQLLMEAMGLPRP
jgi:DNA polymerase